MNLPDHLSPNERSAIEQAVREVVLKFPSQIRFMALFGSKARGDFGAESDIDLLIVSELDDWQTRDEIRTPVFDANFDHGLYISPRIIGWERFQRLPIQQPSLLANLRQDAIELWRRPGTDNPLKTPELTPAA
jgi:hypothetical protein